MNKEVDIGYLYQEREDYGRVNYRITYVFEHVPEYLRAIAKRQIIQAHNEMVRRIEQSNFYEKCAEEFLINHRRASLNKPIYAKFVQKKMKEEILSKMNEETFSHWFYFTIDKDENIIGRSRRRPNVKISFYAEVVDE